MPLEFALRRRINLERPAPRRRLGWLRLPPLALPVGAYWLALTGVFYALRPATASSSVTGTFGDELARSVRALGSAFESDDPSPIAPATSPDWTQGTAALAPTPAVATVASSSNEASVTALPGSFAGVTPDAHAAVERPPEHDDTAAESATASRAEPPTLSRAAPRIDLHAEPRVDVAATPRVDLHADPHVDFQPTPRADVREESEASKAPPSSVDDRRTQAGPSEFAPRDEPQKDAKRSAALPSCEAAAASANETMEIGARRGAPDITRDAFARVLENGAYLTGCAIPSNAALEICAAVQDGKVVGVSVTTAPSNVAINACVRRAVSALRFPRSTRLDVTRTHFAPAR